MTDTATDSFQNDYTAEFALAADAPGAKMCPNCQSTIEPRRHSGGRPKRFCSTACKDAFHSKRSPNVANVGQRGGEQSEPQLSEPDTEKSRAPAEAWEPAEWSGRISQQDETLIATKKDGTTFQVEITQDCYLTGDPDQILISASNVVAFCKMVLYAAGFQNVRICTLDDGGYVFVEDGAESGDFDRQ